MSNFHVHTTGNGNAINIAGGDQKIGHVQALGDHADLDQALKDVGFNQDHLDELHDAIERDGEEGALSFFERAKAGLVKGLTGEIARAALPIAAAALGIGS